MADPLDTLLELVASGRLTAEEAAPLIDALQGPAARAPLAGDGQAGATAGEGSPRSSRDDRSLPKALRIEVTEDGRRVINLRIPLSLGRMGLDHIPGLSSDIVSQIHQALDQGFAGSLLVVDEGDAGDGVRISLE
jgi:hypothetical protein